VFGTKTGTPLPWRNLIRRHLKPILKRAGIPDEGISMYSLRHTSAALQILNGVHIRVIAEGLGTSMVMIDSTYSHVELELDREVSLKLAETLHA
jgi:site-specific recombinase XerD